MKQKELDTLKRQCVYYKSCISRQETFINSYNPETGNIHEVRKRLDYLNDNWEKYVTNYQQLEFHDETENFGLDLSEAEEQYFSVNSKMESILNDNSKQNSELEGSTCQSVNSKQSISQPVGLKLPTINLPKFKGAYTEWINFRDIFDSLIIKNNFISDIQRFHYLNSCLVDEPKILISNIPPTGENFRVAWDLIYTRYNNPRIIIQEHIKALFSLPTAHKESAAELGHLISHVKSNINAIAAFKEITVPLHDLIISYLLLKNVDTSTKKSWELQNTGLDHPTLDELFSFLEDRRRALESFQASDNKESQVNKNFRSKQVFKGHNFNTVSKGITNHSLLVKQDISCILCNKPHQLYTCGEFSKFNVQQRQNIVRNHKLCVNCLRTGHNVSHCNSKQGCKKCNRRHHTALHFDNKAQQSCYNHFNSFKATDPCNSYEITNSKPKQQGSDIQNSYGDQLRQQGSSLQQPNSEIRQSSYCSFKASNVSHVLLATAIVQVRDRFGYTHDCRALLDSASQSNFISESFVNRLCLKKHKNITPIHGISDVKSETKHCVSVTFNSKCSSYTQTISCLVLRKITGDTPCSKLDSRKWGIPNSITLADPTFDVPGNIDILLGAELFFDLLTTDPPLYNSGHPTLINTKLGWVLSGSIPEEDSNIVLSIQRSFFTRTDDIQHQLQRFWEIEEGEKRTLTLPEQFCEEHFQKHTERDESGRYIVRLPLKEDPACLGDSFEGAFSRFLRLEKRLVCNENLRDDYVEFMSKYESLGHMRRISESNKGLTQAYYLPHHPVFKDSTTTKMRVVFDASFKTTSNVSLNDILYAGPTLQQDIYSIILRFRTHEVCFTADIEKMYRQIKIDERDTHLQRILWRNSPNDALQEYELSTVTYGTSAAPFLAVRCLQQLARDEGEKYPIAAEILLRDMYVDDCISGTSTVEEAIEAQTQLIELLKLGGFPIRKWCSNHEGVLKNIPPEDRETKIPMEFKNEEKIKTLGLLWNPASDKFQIVYHNLIKDDVFTKRSVLSTIAAIFDPLGLISPIVIKYKIFLQRLWQARLNWDDQLPDELHKQWDLIYVELNYIDKIYINRLVLAQGKPSNIQIHGFSDASEQAYGACVYVRSTNKNGKVVTNLLCSKSRVAPLKKISVPRLELCGAVLLSNLVKDISEVLNVNVDDIHLWTDSTVVLSWISASPERWKTFVANRVNQIQQNTKTATWHHVSSGDNPADIISRGISVRLLKDNQLWWHGPHWLSSPTTSFEEYKETVNPEALICEQRKGVSLLVNNLPKWDIITKFSRIFKLQRVIAYCFRFAKNCQNKIKITEPLTGKELSEALSCIIRYVQNEQFSSEIAALESSLPISSKSSIFSLSPFIDKYGILRVGGRLEKSLLPFESKHQIILPYGHHLTNLIISSEHLKLLHAGQQLLVSSLRQRFWIPKIRNSIKQIIHKCVICFKLKASSAQQQMGILPTHRVQPARAFLNSGIDYAGPVMLKTGGPRSRTLTKAYIGIFVCFATRAIHIELISNLTSEAFLAALRRFISRRGRCHNLYSDNGTNFIGANNQLREIREFFKRAENRTKLYDFASQEELTWHFIPPSSPHFGGLWEAAVKSMKFHLRRSVGNRSFTYEEMNTLLCQIEAILNSRPITPLSNDAAEFSFLSPAHFLIGENPSLLPDLDLTNVSVNRLRRWEQLQQTIQQLWQRWSTDYLHSIQQRTKWLSPMKNVEPGTLVLIKEETPPSHWRTAIVETVHPGSDGLVRVVTLRTPTGQLKRPIHKLCPFPE